MSSDGASTSVLCASLHLAGRWMTVPATSRTSCLPGQMDERMSLHSLDRADRSCDHGSCAVESCPKAAQTVADYMGELKPAQDNGIEVRLDPACAVEIVRKVGRGDRIQDEVAADDQSDQNDR